MQKADFIGKEALLKHKEKGIEKKLCFLTVDMTDVDPEGNETIWFGGKVLNANYIFEGHAQPDNFPNDIHRKYEFRSPSS